MSTLIKAVTFITGAARSVWDRDLRLVRVGDKPAERKKVPQIAGKVRTRDEDDDDEETTARSPAPKLSSYW